jgi:DNA-binding MarR family transcriptional regulator
VRIESFLKQSPVFQVNRIARKMGASLNLILQEEELTAVESLLLAAIFLEKKGEINPSRLAETFETTRGNVSHCLSSLEAKGLVRRRIDPEDARAFRLLLLPKGKRQAARVVGILEPHAAPLRGERGCGRAAGDAGPDVLRGGAVCAAGGGATSFPKGREEHSRIIANDHEAHSRMILTKMPSGSLAPPRM